MEIKCPNCNYEGEAKSGRNLWIELILFLTTWWLALLPLWLYYGFTKKYICPKCEFKNVIKK